MELLLRLRTPAPDLDGRVPDDRVRDVVVDVDGSHRVRQLFEVTGAERLVVAGADRELRPHDTFAESGLVSGDELLVDPSPRSRAVELDTGGSSRRVVAVGAVALDVVSGPCAGRSFVLEPGRHTVGRADSCDVTVADPTVSRLHLGVDVHSDGRVEVAPVCDVPNPPTINGRPFDVAQCVDRYDVVALGGTDLIARPTCGDTATAARSQPRTSEAWGRIDFHRTPYRPAVIVDSETPSPPAIPAERDVRRFQVLSALAPLLAGLVFFAFSRQPHFLVLTALTPVVMIANTLEDRRSGRRRFERESARFLDDVEAWRAEIDELIERERRTRLDAAPDLAVLARRARDRSADLWARGRTAPDVLRLRLGTGSASPRCRPVVPDQGAEELRRAAHDALRGTDRLDGVPVTVSVAEHGVVGLCGSLDLVDGVTASLGIQAACLHSPEDLVIVAAIDRSRSLGWLRWLPHTRSVTSPLAGAHVAGDRTEAGGLVRRLIEVAEERDGSVRFPRIVVVLDERVGLDAADTARLLDIGPAVGIGVVWCADGRAGVPRQATSLLAVRHAPGAAVVGEMWSVDGTTPIRAVDVETLAPATAASIARALAPVRDASTASPTSSIPRVAPLLDVIGREAVDPDRLADRWAAAERSTSRSLDLSFPIGLGADGPIDIDLVADGPHALIGGTSGSGKSELLQSMVASLAARHPPTRLNFLFVDYKGGASSNVFGRLPHTVGYVTNLSADLARRALVSLRAEVDRRMRLLEGRAKDLAAMLSVAPDDAPASLVIVVDEFATLVKEVPDFLAGIVDVAQRGRSLGVHLVLATQRPSGSVNENILANTNIRIALRMLSGAESTSVIDAPVAAEIPSPLRGRAYVRLGPRRLVAFQGSFGGAPVDVDEAPAARPARMRPLSGSADEASVGSTTSSAGTTRPVHSVRSVRSVHSVHSVQFGRSSTQLDVLVDSVATAASRLRLAPARRPWQEVLPERIDLAHVLDDDRSRPCREHPGRIVAVGRLDEPARQDQRPALVDLEADGGWLVFGSGGSGKTTALRTLAVSAAVSSASISSDAVSSDAATQRRDDLEIVVFDLASRDLAALASLPAVTSIACGDDPEAITRQLAALSAELERRRTGRSAPIPPGDGHRILVIVDGVGGLGAALTTPSGGSMGLATPPEGWLAMFESLVVDGRQYGIHVAMSADRRASVPTRITAAVSNRLVLRHADDAGYADHAIPSARTVGVDLPAGRGWWNGDALVQIATAADLPDTFLPDTFPRQDDVGDRLSSTGLVPPPLPDVVRLGELSGSSEVSGPNDFVLGRGDLARSGEAVRCDLSWSHLLVAGPARSGRSTALGVAIAGLAAKHHVWAVGPASSTLDRSAVDVEGFGRADRVVPVLERLCEHVEAGHPASHLLVVDDLDVFDDMSLAGLWDRIGRLDDLRIVASMETRSLTGFSSNPLVGVLRRARRQLVLHPDDATEFLQATGVKSPIRPAQRLVPGRGVFVSDRQPVVVQVAVPDESGLLR